MEKNGKEWAIPRNRPRPQEHADLQAAAPPRARGDG